MDLMEENKQNGGVSSHNIISLEPPSSQKTQCLASAIQEHLIQQSKRLFQEEIFKESVVKCSLDKDFAYLFQESGLKVKKQKPQSAIADVKKSVKQYNLYIKNIIKWLGTEHQRTLIHLPFFNYTESFQLLNSKLAKDKLTIVITEYHQYFSERLDSMNKNIRWASLSSTLDIQTKSKILELYELKKLNLLLITPELFQNQKYQQFKCDVLLIANIHLYEQNFDLLQRIIQNTDPTRVLGCYEYLTRTFQKKLDWNNLKREYQFNNTVWLKGDHKCKNLLSYLSKRQTLRSLIVVRDKKSADELSASLSLEAYKVTNLLDIISKPVIKSYQSSKLLTKKKGNMQQQLHDSLSRCLSSTIIISPFFDALRLLQYDLVVFYDQPSIRQYMQLQSLSQNILGLLSDEDYYISRNLETSSIVDRTIFQRLVSNILDNKIVKQSQRKVKRFYSDGLDEFVPMDPTSNIKTIGINKICSQYQISKSQLNSILQVLKQLNLVITQDHIKYECLIQERSAEQFKDTFPNYNLMTRRINILSLAAQYKTTTQNILETMKSNNIRFLVCEELIPIRLVANNLNSAVETAWIHSQQKVLRGIREIDLSYTLFDRFTFPNTQFLKKQKLSMKKKQMMSLFEEYLQGNLELQRLPSMKLNNVNKKGIHEWVLEVINDKLTVHDMVLFLQGTLNQRTSIHQDEPIFKSFYKYKYQELAELIQSITSNKKRKTN